MNVVGLDDKSYRLKLFYGTTKNSCSQYHSRARNLLTQVFPFDKPYEEVRLPGTKQACMGKDLYLDFFILRPMIAVEVHGQQHYEYSPFFHGTKMDFVRAKGRDRKKAEWLEKNGITFVELPFYETVEEWTTRLRKAIENDKNG